uniref:VWFD domain-containing protein n=1 Tax=Pinguiococcus pyrenoidosus TaxID=172671 RepID=A0A7R9U176_9STRA|mmetsp:Transcript_10361/g.39198  ORF Transcript_10361/g.39198 Transcript_10361/m.39198 type:complete len:720 (+) Transcript_10361:223-2382(+)
MLRQALLLLWAGEAFSMGLRALSQVNPNMCDPLYGIKDGDGSVCCAKSCGQCGGCECGSLGSGDHFGASFCCPGTIRDDEILCSTPDQVGCVLKVDAIYWLTEEGDHCDPLPSASPSATPVPAPSAAPSVDTTPEDPSPPGGGWGDVHMTTMDGLKYDQQMLGHVSWVKNGGPAGTNFELQVRQTSWRGRFATVGTAMAVTEAGASVIEVQHPSTILVDGAPYDPTSSVVAGASILVGNRGFPITVLFSSGARVTWTPRSDFSYIRLTVPNTSWWGTMSGALGNFNGDIFDDLLPEADPASSYCQKHLSARKWCATEMESLFAYPLVTPDNDEKTFADFDNCFNPNDPCDGNAGRSFMDVVAAELGVADGDLNGITADCCGNEQCIADALFGADDAGNFAIDDGLATRAAEESGERIDALNHMFTALAGQRWDEAEGWVAGADPCTDDYFGVSCAISDNCNGPLFEVTEIDLPGNRLAGSLGGVDFSNLPDLVALDLSDNDIMGVVPEAWCEVGDRPDTLKLGGNDGLCVPPSCELKYLEDLAGVARWCGKCDDEYMAGSPDSCMSLPGGESKCFYKMKLTDAAYEDVSNLDLRADAALLTTRLQAACAHAGLQVALPNSDSENALAYSTCGGDSFLGMYDWQEEGKWIDMNTGLLRYDTAAPGDATGYVNWRAGSEPNDFRVEHFMHFFFDSLDWNDIDRKWDYVCCESKPEACDASQ